MNHITTNEICTCTMCKNNNTTMSIEQCPQAHHKLSLSELIYFIDLSLTKCDQLSDQIDPGFTSSCSNEYPRSLIMSLLKQYGSHHPKDWHKYECWNGTETYTRNLIAHHSNRFTLMLVCWKGGPSPIHNHAGSDCLMSVLRGIVRETKYYIPENEHNIEKLDVKEIVEMQEGAVHLINDHIGLHKMETLDENQQAVTLHCYIPPYLDCFTFDIKDDDIETNIAHTTYDTEYGKTVS
ncbi:unnamed protein product [Rotaria sordida]|uniref:Cysteine dioxygenase n=1 Tax=Rotaria sordida TaxID=392033 RepID=A0A814BYU0_9BILA|nr:unnamed protein product [Rotaria sordida]CAF0935928.1 unnamed protein product [Rotaria sordida]